MIELEIIIEGGVFGAQAERDIEHAAQEGAMQAASDAAEVAKKSTAFKDGSGDLRKSIAPEVRGTFLGDTLEIVVRADDEAASFVNDGTRPHTIRARNKKALQLKSLGDNVFARSVQHPGTAPTHFLDDSLDPQKAGDLVARKIEDALGR